MDRLWTLSIIWKESIPVHCKREVIVSIPEAGKNPVIKDFNREITLIPVIYKVLEKLLMIREEAWFRRVGVIENIEGAGQAKCSSLHTSLILQETIVHNNIIGETTYMALVDTKKAFDTVWVDGLLYKLYRAGINSKAWSLIYDAYTDFTCAALVAGKPGPWFIPQRGVHQGAHMSVHLYQTFIN